MKTPKPWDLNKVSQAVLTSKSMVLDVETEGLDFRVHKICGWVLNFGPKPEEGTYLPVRHKGGANLDPKKVLNCIKGALIRNPGLRVIGHGIHFDLKFAATEGINIACLSEPYEDTLINAFLLNENQRQFSLDACARIAGVTEKKGDELYKHLAAKFGGEPGRDQMGNYHKLAGDDFVGVDYALGDGISTWELWDKQQEGLDAQELRERWMIERRCIRVLARMSLRGVRIDEERLHYVRQTVKRRTEEAARKLPKDFNPRAPLQMAKLLKNNGITGGWPMTPPSTKFPNGQPSYPAAWLKTFPIGKTIVDSRQLAHLESSFLGPLVERHLFKGRVHTTYNQTRGEEFGTVTGRLSSNDPNLQQIHKRDTVLGSLFRSIFIPDFGRMVTADYEQIEPRLLAHYADVQLLIDGYSRSPPIDAHSMVAMSAFNYDPDDKDPLNKAKRQYGKTLNQALITGMGESAAASTIMAESGVSRQEALGIIAAYHRSMPEIKQAQRQISNVFIAKGYLTTLLGGRARLEDSRFAYRGMNRLLQNGNAEIIKKAACDIDECLLSEGDEVQMLNLIHDDIMFQFDEDNRKTYERCLEMMADFGPGRSVELTVPLTVDAKEGRDWAEASYGLDTVKKAYKEMGAVYRERK
jgi:DNA polymerase-1